MEKPRAVERRVVFFPAMPIARLSDWLAGTMGRWVDPPKPALGKGASENRGFRATGMGWENLNG